MTVPSEFEERLRNTFDGRLRIRWSVKNREWNIEQKVGRAITAPVAIEADRDDLICARDGFDYVCTVRTGDRMPCPNCEWTTLKVPVRDFADIQCPYCASKGRQSRTVAGYWPLDDSLIDHLRRIDPHSGRQHAETKDMDARNEARDQAAERQMSTRGMAHMGEMGRGIDWNIPQFGYSDAAQWPSDLGVDRPQPIVTP